MCEHKSLELLTKEKIQSILYLNSMDEVSVETRDNAISSKFASDTQRKYIEECCVFAKWVENKHPECCDIDDMRQYVKEYAEEKMQEGLSAWSVRAYISSLAKLFGCKVNTFGIEFPNRSRVNIRRCRTAPHPDMISKNNDVITFCIATGLTKKELTSIYPEDIYRGDDGNMYVRVAKGKRGVARTALVIKEFENFVSEKASETPPGEHIFLKVARDCKIQYFRRQYATLLYLRVARKIEDIDNEDERMYLRKDCNGKVLDRKALQFVGEQIGCSAGNVPTGNIDLDLIPDYFPLSNQSKHKSE